MYVELNFLSFTPICLMGLFNLFKGRQVEAKQGKIQIGFFKVQEWFNAEFSGRIGKADAEIRKTDRQILESLPEIKKSVHKLGKAKIEENHREDSIINSLKENYVKRAISLCNKFPADISQDFGKKVQATLNELNSPNPKEIFVVSTYFKGE